MVFGKIKSFVSRALGSVVPVVKKVGSFLAQHHQPIALGFHGLAEASGNERLKGIANVGLMASGVASGLGFGKDYVGGNKVS